MMIRRLVGLVAGLLVVTANAAPPNDPNEQIANLEAQNVRIKTHPRTGRVHVIGAWPQAPLIVPTVNEVTRADVAGMAAVKHFGRMFGLTSPQHEMQLVSEDAKPRGGSRHRYRQLHKGIPVLTGELLVNMDKYRRLISMSGEISTNLHVEIRPEVDRPTARKAALATIAKYLGTSYHLAIVAKSKMPTPPSPSKSPVSWNRPFSTVPVTTKASPRVPSLFPSNKRAFPSATDPSTVNW